jgi:phospholipase C
LPFYIVSPWTRGGSVFTEHCDHNSQIMFIEKWLAAKGINVYSDQVAAWRRAHMSDLTNAFNFDAPDYSVPELPYAVPPHTNATGFYDGSSHCEATYSVLRPPVPYGQQAQQTTNVSSLSETGFKSVRGALTEGRYLTFEMNGYALTNPGAYSQKFTSSQATADHTSMQQRWVLHQLAQDGNTFIISSAIDGSYMGNFTSLRNNSGIAEQYEITFLGVSNGYAFMQQNGMYLAIEPSGTVSITSNMYGFQLFSVT